MKALKIINCRDPHMWYGYSIGRVVPLIGEENDYYWSREADGYKNIIYKTDAIIVEVEEKTSN